MKNIKIYILLIIAVTLISSIYVFLKVDDDDIKYDARLIITIHYPTSFYNEHRNLYITEVNNFLTKINSKFRYIDTVHTFQMKGTKKQILKNLLNLKDGLHEINDKNYNLTNEFFKKQRNYLEKLIKLNNSDIKRDIKNYIQSSIENISIERVSNHLEYYKSYSNLINDLSMNDLSFYAKSKTKYEIINILITICIILILIIITFYKENIFLNLFKKSKNK